MRLEYNKINFFGSNIEAEEKIRKLVKQLVEILIKSDDKALKALLLQNRANQYLVQSYMEKVVISENRKMIFNCGYVSALIDVMDLYIKKLQMYNIVMQEEKIFSILAREGTILDKDLATILKISCEILEKQISKINCTDKKLINIDQFGKRKLYSIVPDVYKCIKEIKFLDKNDLKNEEKLD